MAAAAVVPRRAHNVARTTTTTHAPRTRHTPHRTTHAHTIYCTGTPRSCPCNGRASYMSSAGVVDSRFHHHTAIAPPHTTPLHRVPRRASSLPLPPPTATTRSRGHAPCAHVFAAPPLAPPLLPLPPFPPPASSSPPARDSRAESELLVSATCRDSRRPRDERARVITMTTRAQSLRLLSPLLSPSLPRLLF